MRGESMSEKKKKKAAERGLLLSNAWNTLPETPEHLPLHSMHSLLSEKVVCVSVG